MKNSMLEHGITPPEEIIADGNIHRFGHKHNGWYVCYGDFGSWGEWASGITVKWRNRDASKTVVTKADKDRMIAEKIKRDKDREANQLATAALAKVIYGKSVACHYHTCYPYQPYHPYLIKKGLKDCGVARFYNGRLVIPIYNKSGIVNLQFIAADGTKRFLKNGIKKGCYCPIRLAKMLDRRKAGHYHVIICEGFATGMSLADMYPEGDIYAALDCGNLLSAALAIKQTKYNKSYSDFVIAADNDESGIGLRYAQVAAAAVNGRVIMPKCIGDFNDMALGHIKD